jgi:hypothetical protein
MPNRYEYLKEITKITQEKIHTLSKVAGQFANNFLNSVPEKNDHAFDPVLTILH